jgi:hypothetical protein
MKISRALLNILLFFLVYLSCTSNSSIKNNLQVESDYLLSDTTIFAHKFLESIREKKAIKMIFNKNDFPVKVIQLDKSLIDFRVDLKVGNNDLTYHLYSKNKILEPYLLYYDAEDYVYSTFELNGNTYIIDTMLVNNPENEKGLHIKNALALYGMGLNAIFEFNSNNYGIIEAYLPCGGSYCNEHYFFLVNFDESKIIPFVFYDIHPFYINNLVVGDWNDDNQLEFFRASPERKYLTKVNLIGMNYGNSSIIHIDKVPMSFKYSCNLCLGESNDTLIVSENFKTVLNVLNR